jgi:hypothetical protein
MTDGQDAQRRIPDWARRWVADLAATLGWSDEQADEYIRIPDEVLTPVVADLTATLGWSREDAEEFVFENACSWESGVPRLVVLAESVSSACTMTGSTRRGQHALTTRPIPCG